VPLELVEACVAEDCVLYAGNGLSAQAGLPTWRNLLGEMLEWAIQNNIVDDRIAASLRAGLEQRETEPVSDGLLHAVGDRLDALQNFLRNKLLRKCTPSNAHRILGGIPFSAVLTTNFDELLENTFRRKSPKVYTPNDADALLTALTNRCFFILKLRGSLNSPEAVMISAAQYDEKIGTNRTFSTLLETLFFSRCIFFVGARLETIEAYLKGLQSSSTRRRGHYALIDVADNLETWNLKSESFSRRYNINVIPYVSSGHVAVENFVSELASHVKDKRREKSRRPSGRKAATKKGALKTLTLTKIGPFDELKLDLNAGWNVLLGDNGVGKSTVLKALATAICGREAQPYANRLIKVGEDLGTIELETDGGTIYRTKIVRSSVEAELTSEPVRPLEAEGWLALGFPSTRILSWGRPKTSETRVERRPSPEDLLPLIQGIADPRIDKVKNWLVNLDYWIKDARLKNEDSQRYEQMRSEFFSAVRELASGTKVEYGGIESQADNTFEVKILTNDGEMPLDAISQGTASLIGWIGVLLQRLHEIPPDSNVRPMDRYALVLIDELDAHMHPAWQQALIPHLKRIFKNIQFIATTHSPFLAIGRKASEIVRLSRDPHTGRARGEPIDYDTTQMGVANVLTSYLFGLESPMDYELQGKLRRKRALAVKPHLSDRELADLRRLTKELEDVDAVAMFRDPLYKRFVEAMTTREKMLDAGGVKMTKEREDEQRKVSLEILEELCREDEVHRSRTDRAGDKE
jgi:energy-coupling factor transporter ATP-binding protein EcfA2